MRPRSSTRDRFDDDVLKVLQHVSSERVGRFLCPKRRDFDGGLTDNNPDGVTGERADRYAAGNDGIQLVR